MNRKTLAFFLVTYFFLALPIANAFCILGFGECNPTILIVEDLNQTGTVTWDQINAVVPWDFDINVTNRLFSLLTLDDNSSFDSRYLSINTFIPSSLNWDNNFSLRGSFDSNVVLDSRYVRISDLNNQTVSQIIAGTNITITPLNGIGVVTINSSGGGLDTNAVGITQDFNNSDLVSGVLTVSHNLDRQYPQAQVIDDTNQLILPDSFTFSDVNTLIVDLNSFAPITNTWRVVLDSSH